MLKQAEQQMMALVVIYHEDIRARILADWNGLRLTRTQH